MVGREDHPSDMIAGWPVPNYQDPSTRGNAGLIVVGLLACAAVVAIFLRFWARFRLLRNAGRDDWIFLVTVLPTFAYVIGYFLAAKVFMYDRHIWDIPTASFIGVRKIGLANCVFYIVSTCLIKVSVLCFYLRLTKSSISKTFIRVVWVMIGLEACQLVVCVGVLCLGCAPLSAYWNQFRPGWTTTHAYSCVPQAPALLGMSIISVVQDFIATVLPFTLFLDMQISGREKFALGCTFAGGLLVCAAGLYRMYAVYYMYYLTSDLTWAAYDYITASVVEILLATIVASAPALRYYIRHTFDNKKNILHLTDISQAGMLSKPLTTRTWSNATSITDCPSFYNHSSLSMKYDNSRGSKTEHSRPLPLVQEIELFEDRMTDLSQENARKAPTVAQLNGAARRNFGSYDSASAGESPSDLTVIQEDLRCWFERTSSSQEVGFLNEGIMNNRLAPPLRLAPSRDVCRVVSDELLSPGNVSSDARRRKSSVLDLLGLQQDLSKWLERRPSVQEVDLVKGGIIDRSGPAVAPGQGILQTFSYPWVNSSPGEEQS